MIRPGLALALLALTAAGCDREPMPEAAAPATAEAPAPNGSATGPPAGTETTPDTPPGVAPLSSRGTPAAARAVPPEAAAGIQFELPESWRREPPSSSMRLAQAEIPGPGGPGQLTVFFFGPGGGGGMEANIERWIGQMEVTGEPRRESFEANGLQITWVDVSGTLLPSQMGMGPDSPQPGSRMFGAVAEGPGGPWFFKATGPEATLEAAREDFLALLRGLAPASS